MRRTRPVRNPLITGINIAVFNSAMIVVALAVFVAEFASAPPFQRFGLPKAKHAIWMPEADQQRALNIELRGGRVFYRNDLVALSDLRARIAEDLSHGADQKVYLSVNPHEPYRAVKEVLDCAVGWNQQNRLYL